MFGSYSKKCHTYMIFRQEVLLNKSKNVENCWILLYLKGPAEKSNSVFSWGVYTKDFLMILLDYFLKLKDFYSRTTPKKFLFREFCEMSFYNFFLKNFVFCIRFLYYLNKFFYKFQCVLESLVLYIFFKYPQIFISTNNLKILWKIQEVLQKKKHK